MTRDEELLAFVDVETTGGHPAWHRITEIAIVGMRGEAIEWQFNSLVNPQTRIPPTIQRLTGISDDMVAAAPTFASLAEQVAGLLAGRRFVAHNARFDYGFVRQELRRAGVEFAAPVLCTVRLSRELFPEQPRHNLDSIIERHGLRCAQRHRALPDAQVLADLWQRLRVTVPAEELEAAIERAARRPALPPQLPADLPDALPESSGVYRFYGDSAAGEALLYVGKANNLRERVLEHFRGAVRDTKSQRLTSQLRRIEWTETAGELGALLLEARWVREQQPVYNRKLRGGITPYTWWLEDGQATPRLQSLHTAVPEGGDAFGLYRSEREARTALSKIAREARLCLRVLGLEAAGSAGASGSCFGYQVGRCAGACVSAEPLARHGLRLRLQLAPFRLQPWPYRGAIAVEEVSTMGLQQWHILDRWCYLGSLEAADLESAECQTERLAAGAPGFDADTYRILTRFLKRQPRGIRPWPASANDQSES